MQRIIRCLEKGTDWSKVLQRAPEMTPEEFIHTYESALKTQAWDNVDPLFHDMVCVTFSNGEIHNGKQKVKAAFQKNFSLIESEEYSIRNVRWVLKNESIATYVFDYDWQGIINGKRVSGEGNGTSVLVSNNGKWVMLIESLHKSVK